MVAGSGFSPGDLALVRRFIERNREVLMGAWEGERFTAQRLAGLQRIL
ncbi:MAG: DUF4160 domain-containing protein [Magnetococcales bacterium]|nr:DUF4160 domain-containing protein [Magnetococcales bacterium]